MTENSVQLQILIFLDFLVKHLDPLKIKNSDIYLHFIATNDL